MNSYSVSICTFAVNEVESLRICVDTILQTCAPEDIHDIIFCTCEKTTPACRNMLRLLKEENPEICIREIAQPSGTRHWGEACRVMFDSASGSHILSMSSDLECDPVYVADLIRMSKQRPEALVKASRWMDGAGFSSGYGLLRKIGNRIFQTYMRLLFGADVSDYTYSFQIAPKEVFRSTYFHRNGRTVAIELIAGPVMRKIPVIEIPVAWKKRNEAPRKNRLPRDVVHLFWYVVTAIDIRFRLKR